MSDCKNGHAGRYGRSANKEISHYMKKLMSTMLALALVVGTATVTFAQGDDKDKKASTKKKGAKKKGDAKSGDAKDKDAPKKGKAKKGKDGDTK
jgi:hypothetical protein